VGAEVNGAAAAGMPLDLQAQLNRARRVTSAHFPRKRCRRRPGGSLCFSRSMIVDCELSGPPRTVPGDSANSGCPCSQNFLMN
jgi:hypothetical protein